MIAVARPQNRLLRQRLLLVAVVLSILISAAASLPGLPPCLVIVLIALAVLLGVPAAIAQYKSSGAFERPFSSADLVPGATGELRLDIGRREHGRGKSPAVTLLLRRERPDTGFEEADTDTHISDHGDISLVFPANSIVTLAGKVLIS